MSSTAVVYNRTQAARHNMIVSVAARLSAHLAQADEYERLWHRRVQGILRRRRIELALLDQVQGLRQRVLELEAQNETLASFDRTVAHELKNALSRIIGYAEVLTEKDSTVTGEQLDHCLGVIAQDGRKLSNMIDALLLLCGASAGEVKIEPLDMACIVSGALERLAPLIEDYRAVVTVLDAWPAALGYGPWIEEVWVNLVSNACKYGGMPPRVELGASPLSGPPFSSPPTGGIEGGRHVRFWVRDNGPGLSAEQQASLFEPFTRFHQGRANGNGLGLSIVRHIVERLGGQVGVESDGAPGQGCVFHFDLPKVSG